MRRSFEPRATSDQRRVRVARLIAHHPSLIAVAARRGFTFVELMMGLIVTGLVMGALAGLTFAVSKQWQASERSQSRQVTNRQVQARLDRTLRSARCLGYCGGPSTIGSAVMFWKGDANLDGQMQLGEVAMLGYDRQAMTLRLYQTRAGAAASIVCNACDIDDGTDAYTFATSPNTYAIDLCYNVIDAAFAVYGTGGNSAQRPSLEYQVTIRRADYDATRQNATNTVPDQDIVIYGTVTLRGPGGP